MARNQKTDKPFKFKTCYCRAENRDKFYKKWTEAGWEFLYETQDCGGEYKIMRFRRPKDER